MGYPIYLNQIVGGLKNGWWTWKLVRIVVFMPIHTIYRPYQLLSISRDQTHKIGKRRYRNNCRPLKNVESGKQWYYHSTIEDSVRCRTHSNKVGPQTENDWAWEGHMCWYMLLWIQRCIIFRICVSFWVRAWYLTNPIATHTVHTRTHKWIAYGITWNKTYLCMVHFVTSKHL